MTQEGKIRAREGQKQQDHPGKEGSIFCSELTPNRIGQPASRVPLTQAQVAPSGATFTPHWGSVYELGVQIDPDFHLSGGSN